MTAGQLVSQVSTEKQLLNLNVWRLRMHAFRIFLCLEIIFIGLPYLTFLDTLDRVYKISLPDFLMAFVVFVVLPFIVFWQSNVRSYISMLESSIEFPRLFFWVRKVGADSISSIEEMKIRGKEFGVLVGLRTGSIIHYGVKDFQDGADYEHFKQGVNRILGLNRNLLISKLIKIRPIDWTQNVLLLLILGIWLIVFFSAY